jgi:hypothetical protein
MKQKIVTGLDGLGTTLIRWVRKYKVGSIPTVTTKPFPPNWRENGGKE